MQTPVLLLVYNRPVLVKKQLDFLLQTVGVKKLFISGDGAKNSAADQTKVLEVQALIQAYKARHPRRIQARFSSKNQGCQLGVEAGLDWFFSKVEAGIILEDDCVPDESFFPYCEKLLAHYKNDDRIGMISGTNPLSACDLPSSYFFSRQSIVWGWASWKRAWGGYKQTKRQGLTVLGLPAVRSAVVEATTPKHPRIFEKVLRGEIDTWDYIWYLTNIFESRYCIIPTNNLVSNVGFAVDATHTKIKTTQAELPVTRMSFPLIHPSEIMTYPHFEKEYLKQLQPLHLLTSIARAYLRFFPAK